MWVKILSTGFIVTNYWRVISALIETSSELLSRLSIIGDVDQDEFRLRIENVRKSDEGTYSCQYGPRAGGDTVMSMEAELTVLVPPSAHLPWCSVFPASGAVGETVYLQCNSQGGDPLPNITYYKGDEVLASSSRSITHQYPITAEDNGVIFTCILTTPPLDESRNCSVMPLRILPNATIQPAVSRVEQGSYASFECYGEGVPRIANYRWEVKNRETGEILSSKQYTLLADDRVLVMTVTGNFEVQCTVSVPSGLSANSSARIDVVKLAQTTMKMVLTNNPSSPSNEQLSSTTVAVTIVAVVLALAVIILIILLLWQRKHRRKSTSPPDGARMRQAGHEYDEVAKDEGKQSEPQGNQQYAYAATLEDKANDGQDGGITSEYLEMQESPTHKGSKESAYQAVQQDKNDDTADTGKYEAVSVGKIDKMSGQGLDDPTQDSSGYEMPTKLAHV